MPPPAFQFATVHLLDSTDTLPTDLTTLFAARPLEMRRPKFPPPLGRQDQRPTSKNGLNHRFYVGLINNQESYSLIVNLSRFRPKVKNNGFSLIQTAVINHHPNHPMQTIEASWQRFGSDVCRFFTYFTATDYNAVGLGLGGYDGEYGNWKAIPSASKFQPGDEMPASHIDGPQAALKLRWQLLQNVSLPDHPDGWYLNLDGNWIGCYPLTLFTAQQPPQPPFDPSTTLADHATQIQVYGEVWDPDYDRSVPASVPQRKPTTDMGSGKFPEEGYGKAAFIANIIRQASPKNLPECWEEAAVNWKVVKEPAPPVDSDVGMYDIKYFPKSSSTFRSFCYAGGTGAPIQSGTWSEWDNVSGIIHNPQDKQFESAPGESITVLQRSETVTDLLLMGVDGKVYYSYWFDEDWSGFNNKAEWRPLDWGPQNTPTFVAGTKVAAVGRAIDNVDIFAIGADGKLWTAWWALGQDRSGWRAISGSSPRELK